MTAVAVVGARAASVRACAWARELGRQLGTAGVAVISGGAFGIDGAAHRGALDVGAPTFAVLGCGVDVVYPDRHAGLFDEIALTGGLLSEYPPGTNPRPGQFPKRNRIIAALVDGVVVVEAAARSGALGTARMAAQLGVPVLAYPGSAGTGHLIRDGAVAVEAPGQVMGAITDARAALRAGRVPAAAGGRPVWSRSEVPERFGQLLRAMTGDPSRAEMLALRLEWTLAEVLGVLGQAEIEGWIRRVPGGAYEVTRGH